MSTRSTPPAVQTAPSYTGPFITVAVLFFIFGFITNLNMALVPYLRQSSDSLLPYCLGDAGRVGILSGLFCVLVARRSKLIEAIGYKKTMVVSLFIQVVGCLLFVPAAQDGSFPLFLTAVFIVGAGVTALQTAANPYVAILGPEHSAPARLTLAQALNSLGGTIAPLVAGALHPHRSGDRSHPRRAVANTVRGPYIAIARRTTDPRRGGRVHAPAAHLADAGVPTCQGRRPDSRAAASGAIGTRCSARSESSSTWASKWDWPRSL